MRPRPENSGKIKNRQKTDTREEVCKVERKAEKQEESELMKQLLRELEKIKEPDQEAGNKARKRFDSVAKPLRSLGVLEDDIVRAAQITGTEQVDFGKKAVVIMCADNGIVEEGVSQTGKEVTAVVTANFTRGESCVCLMAEQAGAHVFPVDIGVECRLENLGKKYPLLDRKVRKGTGNFLKEPALTKGEVAAALKTGMELVGELKEKGYGLIATGEMGIGNTTTSSAVVTAALGIDPFLVTGRGAGLDSRGLLKKISVIRKGIELHRPDPHDGIDILSKVGGLDLAGLAGVFLGGALFRVPVLIDGFISGAAALMAQRICSKAPQYMIASHVSAEPAGQLILETLGCRPAISAGMCLGEGTGAVALMPLLDMALCIYRKMSTFEEIEIEEYRPLS